MTEKFKGDVQELKFENAGKPAFDQTGVALDEFYAGGYDASPFLLMLYDEKRVPFYDRIERKVFVDFYKEALKRYGFSGSFDSYIFVLKAIFGELSDIFFEIPNPGVLNIDISSASTLDFDFIARDVSGNIFDMIDNEGNILTFRGIAGIETAYELELLFSEIMPCGISPHISLSFFARYNFIAEDEFGDFFDMTDNLGNNIVFVEVGD